MNEKALDLTFRVADQNDLADLLALYKHLISTDLPTTLESQKQTFREMLSHPGLSVIVGHLGDKLVTSCTLVVIPNLTRGCASYAVIENVITHTDFRGMGIGEKIMRQAIQRAWDAGCYKVMLMSGSQNGKANTFYQRLGFQKSKIGFETRRPGYASRPVT
ncbi:putative acetyltransferase [Roseibium album]|nr:putative acetyltransferase [Roseibium album]